MRLTQQQIRAIKQVITEVLGAQAEVRLFGSRVDDAAKGGDIDLYIHLNQPIERPAYVATLIQAKLIRAIGERKVDILLDAPNLKRVPIHQVAEQTGISL